MYKHNTISLVIPCYNEESGLEEILRKTSPLIDEVIVVDNDSNDSGAEVAKRHGALVMHLKKRGYGLACKLGLSKASKDIIVLIDGDNTYPISDAGGLIRSLEEKDLDFLTGCRFPLVDKTAMPFVKRISNRITSWIIRKLFHINLVDSQSGMFVLKKEFLSKILPSNPGMGFTHEIKLRAWLNQDIRSAEEHINYQKRIGRVKYRPFRDGLETIWDLFKFWYLYKSNKDKPSLDTDIVLR